MLKAKYFNDFFKRAALLAEKQTGKTVVIPYIFSNGDLVAPKQWEDNFKAIEEAYN